MASPFPQSPRWRCNIVDSVDLFTACVADFRPSSNLHDFDPTAAEPIPFRRVFRAGRCRNPWEATMRVLFGIILGVALTVSVAFISDTWTTGPTTTTGSGSAVVEHRPMVNWDVVGDNMRVAQERAREAWMKLSHKITS